MYESSYAGVGAARALVKIVRTEPEVWDGVERVASAAGHAAILGIAACLGAVVVGVLGLVPSLWSESVTTALVVCLGGVLVADSATRWSQQRARALRERGNDDADTTPAPYRERPHAPRVPSTLPPRPPRPSRGDRA